MKTLIYVHGYGSDRSSRKFLALKKHLSKTHKCYCLEWIVHSDIPFLLEKTLEKCKNIETLDIVGDSTGANLAYQLREMRNISGDGLVLLSPLLYLEQIKCNIPFPSTFLKILRSFTNPKKVFIIASKKDCVLNQDFLFGSTKNNYTLLEVDDDHSLTNFENYLDQISTYFAQKK